MTKQEIITECKTINGIGEFLLSLTATKNPIDIASTLGVTIRYIESNKDTFGFVLKGDLFETSTIYINKDLDNYSKKIICAHELGHLFSDTILANEPSLFDTNIDSESEFFANYMVKCLMPNVFVFAALDKYETIHEFNSYVHSRIHFKEK